MDSRKVDSLTEAHAVIARLPRLKEQAKIAATALAHVLPEVEKDYLGKMARLEEEMQEDGTPAREEDLARAILDAEAHLVQLARRFRKEWKPQVV